MKTKARNLRYKGQLISAGRDKRITRREVREILNVTNARITQLTSQGKLRALSSSEYSLRIVLDYKRQNKINEKKQAYGKLSRTGTARVRKRCVICKKGKTLNETCSKSCAAVLGWQRRKVNRDARSGNN